MLLISAVFILILYFVHYLYNWVSQIRYRLPPNPPGLPILGNVLEFSSQRSYYLWATEMKRKYGNVFMLRVGLERLVIINDYNTAVEALVVKHNKDLAGRPKFVLFSALTENCQDIIMANYCSRWKTQRKITHNALRIFMKGVAMENLLLNCFTEFEKCLSVVEFVDPYDAVQNLFFNIVCSALFGEFFEINSMKSLSIFEIFKEMSSAVRKMTIIEAVPVLWYLPLPILNKFKRNVTSLLKFIQNMINSHNQNSHNCIHQDITDYFLAEVKSSNNHSELSEVHVRQCICDLIIAGTDTSTAVFYWLLALLACHQDIQRKIFEEIFNLKQSLPPNAKFSASEWQNRLPYTQATIEEVLRYSVVVPRGLPHLALKDCEIGGFDVPKGSIVFLNTYSLHFDEKYWKDPFLFQPERFLDKGGNFNRKESRLGAFGLGIRKCLGENIAKTDLLLLTIMLCRRYYIVRDPSNLENNVHERDDNNFTRLPKSFRIKFKVRENMIDF